MENASNTQPPGTLTEEGYGFVFPTAMPAQLGAGGRMHTNNVLVVNQSASLVGKLVFIAQNLLQRDLRVLGFQSGYSDDVWIANDNCGSEVAAAVLPCKSFPVNML